MKNIGHTCDEAEDGQIAVDKVKEKGLTMYDAILMDFVMVRPPFPRYLSCPFPPHSLISSHLPCVVMNL